MKSHVFTAWKELVEQFLKNIATETVPYATLETWMDKQGAAKFQQAQHAHFLKNKDAYLESGESNPYQVKSELAAGQLEYGFSETYKQLVEEFPVLNSAQSKQHFDNFSKEAMGEKYLPLFALRAVVAAATVKSKETDRMKMFNNVMALYNLVEFGVVETKAAMLDSLPKAAAQSTLFGNNAAAPVAPVAPAASTAMTTTAPAAPTSKDEVCKPRF